MIIIISYVITHQEISLRWSSWMQTGLCNQYYSNKSIFLIVTGEFFPKVIFHLTEEYFEIQGETSFIGHRKFENKLKLT